MFYLEALKCDPWCRCCPDKYLSVFLLSVKCSEGNISAKPAAGTVPGIFIPVANWPSLDSMTSCSDHSSTATIEFELRKCFQQPGTSKTNTHSDRERSSM